MDKLAIFTNMILVNEELSQRCLILLQSFHMAGDGKLGGLVDPNDGLCHLNSSGFYEWSTVQGESRNVSRVEHSTG